MENVFSYFFAIGSGFALGVSVIVLPVMWLVQKKKGKKRVEVGKKHAIQ